MAEFTFYWMDGKRTVLKGRDKASAFTAAGFGSGALKAVDFIAHGNDHAWVWSKTTRNWGPVPAEGIGDSDANTGERKARAR